MTFNIVMIGIIIAGFIFAGWLNKRAERKEFSIFEKGGYEIINGKIESFKN